VRHSLDVHRRVFGTNHTDTLSAINNMAGVELSLGRLSKAEALYRELSDARQSVLGVDHPWTIQSQVNLGTSIMRQRRAPEAEAVFRDALARSERVQGPDHARTLDIANALATAVRLQERIGEAETILRDVADRSRRSLPANHSDTILAVANLALILDQQGKFEEALKCYEEVYAGVQVAELTPLKSARYTAAYAVCLVRLKRFDEAEQPLLEAKKRLETANMQTSSWMRQVIASLVLVCDNARRTEEASRWRAEVKRLDALLKPATSGPSSG
jgi:tetratricopeptide (TPR) repeat protein